MFSLHELLMNLRNIVLSSSIKIFHDVSLTSQSTLMTRGRRNVRQHFILNFPFKMCSQNRSLLHSELKTICLEDNRPLHLLDVRRLQDVPRSFNPQPNKDKYQNLTFRYLSFPHIRIEQGYRCASYRMVFKNRSKN